MKQLGFSILIVLLLIGQMTFAQQRRGHFSPEKHLEQLKTELDLTDKQVKEVQKIMADGQEKMKALRNQEGDRASKKAAFKALKAEKVTAIEKVLTPKQLKIWNIKKAERQEKRAAMKAERKANRKNRKKITPEQRKALRKETKQYVQKNILPTLQKQRAKLDKQMVAADRNKVDELRGIVKEIMPKIKAQKKQFKAERKAWFKDLQRAQRKWQP